MDSTAADNTAAIKSARSTTSWMFKWLGILLGVCWIGGIDTAAAQRNCIEACEAQALTCRNGCHGLCSTDPCQGAQLSRWNGCIVGCSNGLAACKARCNPVSPSPGPGPKKQCPAGVC